MIEIKVTVPTETWNMARQSPGRGCVWNGRRFHFADTLDEYDYWIVYDGIPQKKTVKVPKENTIFVTGEPPSIKMYDKRFLDQFGAIVTFRRDIAHRHLISDQPSLPWWVGKRLVREEGGRHQFLEDSTLDYDGIKRSGSSQKQRLLSVITSGKQMTEGHKRRLSFVSKLKERFGEDVDIFAPGERELIDKWDAIAPYRYQVVIENEVLDKYWTEKLADPFLGFCHPMYHGCPNVGDFFPAGSYTPIDIGRPEEALDIIEQAIRTDAFGRGQDSLAEAKRRVMDEYNFFPSMARICDQPGGSKTKVVIHPEGRTSMGRVHRLLSRGR